MSNELIVAPPTSIVANTSEELAGMNAPVLEWAERKLALCITERNELVTARDEAKERKWKVTALAKAAASAIARVTFYEKVRDALAAGYMLFPPVPNADCIAIRVHEDVTHGHTTFEQESGDWNTSPPRVNPCDADAEPSGEGKYVTPVINWRMTRKWTRESSDGKKETVRNWEALPLQEPEFPLLMAKPEIIRCVDAAMETKIFDEIRMFPFERKGDPCILGAVWDKRNKKRHYFLISWLVREQDI